MRDPADAWKAIQRAIARCAGHPLVRRFVRSGFLARGAVYAVVAALALALALGAGGETTDTRGALAEIAETEIGRALLVALGVALTGLALFFLLEAILPARDGSGGLWAAAMRVGNAGGAVGYGFLAFAAERLASGAGAGPATNQVAKGWTQRALDLPGGRWLVLAIAAVILFVGARQATRGLRRAFLEDLPLSRVPRPLRRWAVRLGTVGFSVQGAVLVLVGVFFGDAGLRDAPRVATGFDGALAAIARQRWGSALLGVVAIGLLAYAAYSLVEGHFRRLRG